MEFTQKKHAYLVATDIASRGMDFPAVNWVIQLDCPEDVQTYLHRIGRTARYRDKGSSMLFLDPSEKIFLDELKLRSVEPKQLHARKLEDISG